MSHADTVSIPAGSIVCLTDDLASLPLVKELARISPRCIAGVWCHSEELKEKWLSAGDGKWILGEQWENWLASSSVQLVIFSSTANEHMEALRQLAGAGKSIVIYPRLAHELSLAYELSLCADQTPIDIFPMWETRRHAAIQELRAQLQSGSFGKGIHLQLERKVSLSGTGVQRLLPVSSTETEWIEDAATLDFLAGPFGQLTATRAGETTAGVAVSQIIAGSPQGPQGVWSCVPGEVSDWTLRIAGDAAEMQLHGSPGDSTIQIRERLSGGVENRRDCTDHQHEKMIGAIRQFFTGVRQTEGLRELIRAYELLDASRRSVKRRRTIDLYYDAPTERGNFKTQMAAIGCGVLMYTLFAFVISLGVGELVNQIAFPDAPAGPKQPPPWGNLVMLLARIVTFGPLAFFLALQFLMYFARSSPRRTGNESR